MTVRGSVQGAPDGATAPRPFTPRFSRAPATALAVVLHLAAFAGALMFYGVAGLLLAFWSEALAVSVAWLITAARSRQTQNLLLPVVSLFFLYVHLQFITNIAAHQAGDVFLIFDGGWVWRTQWPAIAFGLLTGVAYQVVGAASGQTLPSPMRKVIVLHLALVFGGILSGFLFNFAAEGILTAGVLTAMRITDDLLPANVSAIRSRPWPTSQTLRRQ